MYSLHVSDISNKVFLEIIWKRNLQPATRTRLEVNMGEEQNERRRVENNSFGMVKMTLEGIIIESREFRNIEK